MQKSLLELKLHDIYNIKSFKRLGHVFKTTNNKYFLDSGTGRVFECGTDEYIVLDNMLNGKNIAISESNEKKAVTNILALAKKYNILQMPNYDNFYESEMYRSDVDDYSNINHLILEVSELCNLQCKYCIYNETHPKFRDFSAKNMTWDIAKKAIQYTLERAKNFLILGFYGGEPLVNFDLMKKSIEYALNNKKQSCELIIACTSNCTLLDESIAQYLSSLENLKFVCSMDGPASIHNKNRVNIQGNPTFEDTLQGLKRLVDAYKKAQKTLDLTIHSVICPPITIDYMDEMYEFFRSLEWLPKNTKYTTSYVDAGGQESFTNNDGLTTKEVYEKGIKYSDPLKFWALTKLLEESTNEYAYSLIKRNLYEIHNRLELTQPRKTTNRNGCCIVGHNRLFVSATGDYKICEKIGNSPSIGDIYDGINYETINKIYCGQYDQQSINFCKNCWAVHLCTICYAYIFNELGIDMNEKMKFCEFAKGDIENDLIIYYELIEHDSKVIEKLNYFEKID